MAGSDTTEPEPTKSTGSLASLGPPHVSPVERAPPGGRGPSPQRWPLQPQPHGREAPASPKGSPLPPKPAAAAAILRAKGPAGRRPACEGPQRPEDGIRPAPRSAEIAADPSTCPRRSCRRRLIGSGLSTDSLSASPVPGVTAPQGWPGRGEQLGGRQGQPCPQGRAAVSPTTLRMCLEACPFARTRPTERPSAPRQRVKARQSPQSRG